MYDVARFRREKLIVHFDDFEDLHEFLCELEENGGFGTSLSRERFEGGFKVNKYRHYYWDKERDRLYCSAGQSVKWDYIVVEPYELTDGDMAPSTKDIVSFLTSRGTV